PELFGSHHDDANIYTGALAIAGRHTQFHNVLYYGIVPILLVWLSILRGLGSRSFGLAATYLAVALTPMYLVQPLSDLVNITIYPVHHDIMCRTGAMFLLCAALVPILRSVRDTGIESDDWRLRWFLALVGIVLACCMAMIVRTSQTNSNLAGGHVKAVFLAVKVLILAGLPACFFAVGRLKLNSLTTARLTHGAIILFWIVVIVLGAVALSLGYFRHSWFTFRGFAYTAAAGLWAIFTICLARTRLSDQTPTRWQWRLLMGMGGAALLICLVPISEYHGPREVVVLMMSGAISMAKFVLLACVALEIVVLCGAAPAGRRQLLPLLGLLTLGELVAQTKLYGHVGTHPFINAADLYPRKTNWEREQADWLASANGPNFLTNSRLQAVGAAVPGWSKGGSQSTAQPTSSGVKIAAAAQDGVTLFQDVTLPAAVDALTMGAWVRSTSGVPVKLLLATSDRHRRRNDNVESPGYTGQGNWEWLTATVELEGTECARPHVAVWGIGEAEITGVSLVRGVALRATPRPAGEVHVTGALVRAEGGQFGFDINKYDTKSYRVNRPTQVLRWRDSDVVPKTNSEVLGNINMVYQVSTYAGLDSDVKKNLLTLINAFGGHPPDWNPRGGIHGTLTNPRLLDILGVKYDWDGQDLIVRPDALARMSLFENFEVLSDRNETLARLQQPDFNPAQSIVLDKQPPQTPGRA
ncbi:MAG TPA: DMT family transporter, partial [Planctomycetaceae bacterium]